MHGKREAQGNKEEEKRGLRGRKRLTPELSYRDFGLPHTFI